MDIRTKSLAALIAITLYATLFTCAAWAATPSVYFYRVDFDADDRLVREETANFIKEYGRNNNGKLERYLQLRASDLFTLHAIDFEYDSNGCLRRVSDKNGEVAHLGRTGGCELTGVSTYGIDIDFLYPESFGIKVTVAGVGQAIFHYDTEEGNPNTEITGDPDEINNRVTLLLQRLDAVTAIAGIKWMSGMENGYRKKSYYIDFE